MGDNSTLARGDGRRPDELRKVRFQPNIAPHASGSTLIECGDTRVICAVTVEETAPKWMRDQKVEGGWLTAEYSMLPYSTLERKARDISKLKIDGRSQEIQRLIGRALRAGIDLKAAGARTFWVDCDVLQADGGTRTAAVTGAWLALALACRRLRAEGKLLVDPLKAPVAAVSCGMVSGRPLLDLSYEEDRDAEVDMNVVMNGDGQYIETQASGEEATFDEAGLVEMLALARAGIRRLLALQKEALAS